MRFAAALLALAAFARTGVLIKQAPPAAQARKNPLEASEDNRRAGARLYEHECAACHGKERQGIGRVPKLDRDEVRNASPGTLFWILRNGSLTHGMPSFAHVPEPERWQIVIFLQSSAGDASR